VRARVDAVVLVEEPVRRHGRVPTEVDLLGRRVVRECAVGGRALRDERRLGDGEFARDGLQLFRGEVVGVGHDAGGVPRERFGRESVDDGDASRVRVGHVTSDGTGA